MPDRDNIDVVGETDLNKTTDLCEINVRFQPKVYNGRHDLTWNDLCYNDVSVVSVIWND